MYLGIDIGGTKVLVGCLDEQGVITEHIKFPTPDTYEDFLTELANVVDKLATKDFIAAGVAAPGKIDRNTGHIIAFGNRPWKNVPLQTDVEHIVKCPVVVENDANLAALSESMLLKSKYNRVMYMTISTGIGIGVVEGQQLDPALIDAEAGSMKVDNDGHLAEWETFASGKAIYKRYGKLAADIHEHEVWQAIAHNLAKGLTNLIDIIQPEIIVLGGSVSDYFDRFEAYLIEELRTYAGPLTPVPPIIKAARPDEAVLYGCYDLAKMRYGRAS